MRMLRERHRWIDNQVFRLAEEEKKSLKEISNNLLGNLKIEIPFKMTNAKSLTYRYP